MSADVIEKAAKRVNYRLTFAAADEPREVYNGGIYGPDLPNAYDPDGPTGSGEWCDPEFETALGDRPTQKAAIDRWFITAVREAIHEALEWYRVDGKLYLDPHGEREGRIHELSERFAAELVALRRSKP